MTKRAMGMQKLLAKALSAVYLVAFSSQVAVQFGSAVRRSLFEQQRMLYGINGLVERP